MIKKLALSKHELRLKKYRRIGYKDSLCGLMKPLKELPADMRAAYREGIVQGMYEAGQMDRELSHD